MKHLLDSDLLRLVELLFEDMNDRSGYDTYDTDEETLQEWKSTWVTIIRGFLDIEAES